MIDAPNCGAVVHVATVNWGNVTGVGRPVAGLPSLSAPRPGFRGHPAPVRPARPQRPIKSRQPCVHAPEPSAGRSDASGTLATTMTGVIDGIDANGWRLAERQRGRCHRPFRYERIGGGRSNLTFAVTDAAIRRYVLRRPPLGHVPPPRTT